MGVAGQWLDRVSAETYHELREGEPPAIVVGSGSWNDLPAILEACGPKTKVFLRDMENDDAPELMARRICDAVDTLPGKRDQLYGYGLNERLVNTHAQRVIYRDRELRLLRECHARNVKFITWNISWGVPKGPAPEVVKEMAEDLRILYDEAELIGPHYYDAFHHQAQGWVDREYSCYRYKFLPDWVDRNKIWSTETGFDSVGRPDDLAWDKHPGWRSFISPEVALTRMRENIARWRKDGIGGFVYFALNTLNAMWDPYYPSEEMLDEWAAMAPFAVIAPPRPPKPNPKPEPKPDPGGDTMPWKFTGGFRDYALAHPDEVGQPLMNERYIIADLVYQVTTTGRLETGKDQNGNWIPVHFYPKAGM